MESGSGHRIEVADPTVGAAAGAMDEHDRPVAAARFDHARVDAGDALWIRNHPVPSGIA